jgi:predicted nucleic acid-binding protein
MGPLIFLDTNVPIYAAGTPHPLKTPCADVLALAATHSQAFLTDAKVLQELLHRYLALRIWTQGRRVVRAFAALMRGRVEPVSAADVEAASLLADQHRDLSARDLVHAAVMGRAGARLIVSADRDFDRLPQVERLDPADVATWQARIVAR